MLESPAQVYCILCLSVVEKRRESSRGSATLLLLLASAGPRVSVRPLRML